jgi:hypothetical protein
MRTVQFARFTKLWAVWTNKSRRIGCAAHVVSMENIINTELYSGTLVGIDHLGDLCIGRKEDIIMVLKYVMSGITDQCVVFRCNSGRP